MQAGTAVADLASAIGIRTEDASLVADLKAGSEEAFALLIAQYHQPIYSLIARNLSDPADAADITQDVFIKVFRNIRSFNGDARGLEPAPLVVAPQTSGDHHRRSQRARRGRRQLHPRLHSGRPRRLTLRPRRQ